MFLEACPVVSVIAFFYCAICVFHDASSQLVCIAAVKFDVIGPKVKDGRD